MTKIQAYEKAQRMFGSCGAVRFLSVRHGALKTERYRVGYFAPSAGVGGRWWTGRSWKEAVQKAMERRQKEVPSDPRHPQ